MDDEARKWIERFVEFYNEAVGCGPVDEMEEERFQLLLEYGEWHAEALETLL